MQRVPFGILYQAIYPGGRRLPKLPSLMPVSKETATYNYSYSPYQDRLPSHYARRIVTPKVVGNLPEEAYRFFVGREQGELCQCRGCLMTLHGKELRTKHIRECKYLVLETLKLLHKDHRCVMCNNHTTASKWGVPLCAEECQSQWRFSIPVAFHEARRLALKANPNLEKR